jgi:hypothetical protein
MQDEPAFATRNTIEVSPAAADDPSAPILRSVHARVLGATVPPAEKALTNDMNMIAATVEEHSCTKWRRFI